MDIHQAQAQFAGFLRAVRDGEHTPIEGQERYPTYMQHALKDQATIRKYWYFQLSHVRHVRDHLEGKTLMDAGCGSGTLAVLLSLLGARRVLAVDFVAEQVEQARFLVRAAGVHNVKVIQSDISALNMAPQTVDGIFSIEAISHYRGYDSFLDTVSTLLRPGGFVTISDGNNAASPQVRALTHELWDAFENSPEAGTIHGHPKGEGCYRDMREIIIRNAFPELDEQTARLYAGYTFGYSKESTILAVGQFLKGDHSLRAEWSPGKCPLDPECDCYMERLVHPHRLARELTGRGFRCTVKSNGPISPELAPLRHVWEALSPLTIYMPRGFTVTAFKSSGSCG